MSFFSRARNRNAHGKEIWLTRGRRDTFSLRRSDAQPCLCWSVAPQLATDLLVSNAFRERFCALRCFHASPCVGSEGEELVVGSSVHVSCVPSSTSSEELVSLIVLRGRVRRGGRRSHALGLIDLIESFGSKDLFLLCAEPEELLPLDSGPLYYVTSDDSEDERSESLGWKRMEVGFMKRDDSELRILMDACRSRGIHAMALVVGSTSNGDQRKKAMEIADALDEYMELRADRNASWSIPPSWDAVFGTETLPNHSEMYG